MLSRKFSELLDELFGKRQPEAELKPEGAVTPIVPTDVDALMKAAADEGPYAQILNGKPLLSPPPYIVIQEASGDVMAEVQLALGQEIITGAPAYMRPWLCALTAASGDRVGFYSTFRHLKETELTFLKGLELWLRRNTFRVEDPDIDKDDRDGWGADGTRLSSKEDVCPAIRLDKDGREIISELVYIFAGLQI